MTGPPGTGFAGESAKLDETSLAKLHDAATVVFIGIKKRLNLSRSLYEMLQISSLNLFEKITAGYSAYSLCDGPNNQLILL